jgi:hypothetical protein
MVTEGTMPGDPNPPGAVAAVGALDAPGGEDEALEQAVTSTAKAAAATARFDVTESNDCVSGRQAPADTRVRRFQSWATFLSSPPGRS